MSFEVKLDEFAGPMQLLLEFIEKQDLDITTVSLAKVTEDYTAYLNSHDVPSHELADFLVIASKLIYLKSRVLLPVEEEQEEPDVLAAQLKLYREFVEATQIIDSLARSERTAYARPRLLVAPTVKFRPPAFLQAAQIQEAFSYLLKRLQPFFALQETSLERVASVQERLRQIHEALLNRARMTFGDVTKGAASRIDVVVSFLALLELMKQKLVRAVQSSAFGEIELTRVD